MSMRVRKNYQLKNDIVSAIKSLPESVQKAAAQEAAKYNDINDKIVAVTMSILEAALPKILDDVIDENNKDVSEAVEKYFYDSCRG